MSDLYKRNPKQARITWNVNMAGPGKQAALDFMPHYQPSAMLLMGDVPGAIELKKLCPLTHVFHRRYFGDSVENFWFNWTSQDWKNVFQEGLDKHGDDYKTVIHQLMNEPQFKRDGWSSVETAKRYTKFVTDVLDWAQDKGIRLAFPIPNAEVTYERLWAGEFDELLLNYDSHGWREHGHVGFIHEYAALHTFAHIAISRPIKDHPTGFFPDILKRNDILQDKTQWATKEDVEKYWGSNFTTFRAMYVNKRMEFLGKQPIPVAVLEAPWDDLPHLHNWKDPRTGQVRDLVKEVTRHYKQPDQPADYASYRGVMALRPLYEAMLPDVVSQDNGFGIAVNDQLEHLDEIAPDWYICFAWFMYAPRDKEWDLKYGCSYHNLKHVQKLMLERAHRLRTTAPTPPPPTPTPNPSPDDPRFAPYRVETVASGGANVRQRPSTSAAIVGSIGAGGVEIAHIPYEALTPAEQALALPENDLDWYLVRVVRSGKQTVGWVRSDVISKPVPVVVEPPPEPPVNEDLASWLAAEEGALAETESLLNHLAPALAIAQSQRLTHIETIAYIKAKMEETP